MIPPGSGLVHSERETEYGMDNDAEGFRKAGPITGTGYGCAGSMAVLLAILGMLFSRVGLVVACRLESGRNGGPVRVELIGALNKAVSRKI